MENFLLPKSLLFNDSSKPPIIQGIKEWQERHKVEDYKIGYNRVALITGITGQDGIYLTAMLLSPLFMAPFVYQVHGIVRKNSASLPILINLQETLERQQGRKVSLTLHYGDVTDPHFMQQTIHSVKPDEIYNFAAQTHVQHSFFMPSHTIDVNFKGLVNICQAALSLSFAYQRSVRIFHASTSEMFGQTTAQQSDSLMGESFPFNPASPYAVSKIASYYLVRYYRSVYQMRISTAISFNHESPLRHESFVTRKITKGVARIKLGIQEKLLVGNLYAKRDWGHARDFVRGFWIINNQELVKGVRNDSGIDSRQPFEDYVIATSWSMPVLDFLQEAFKKAGFGQLQLMRDNGYEQLCSGERVLAKVDPKFLRPGEVPMLRGDPSKIESELGWKAEIQIEGLMDEMLEYDEQVAKLEMLVRERAKL
ncbi:hypothetical protein FGO68_gene8496 [Halteria grandinella]|uniref:GDP-mannose 4,6-dehydratase n=1 Tax=Halteria grandinella TaxID=5974 RepID=A0A8J8NQQ7_HALGN|nr:hypothetical protein FGO68_gene8496 [Halteria grandinella]